MDLGKKAAIISVGLNGGLTILKFVLFSMTGSLAILSEAWHSVADIGTSLMVLISLTAGRRGRRAKGSPEDEGSASVSADPGGDDASRATVGSQESNENRGRRNIEYVVAIGIGLFLLLAAVQIFAEVFSRTAQPVDRPLLAGVFFLFFALGSHFVYRYEQSVGKMTGSIGLVADGHHARADMTGSLLVGGSLILYQIGINLDKAVAVLITLFILSFAVEIIVNTIVSWLRGPREDLVIMRTVTIIMMACDRDVWIRLIERLEKKSGLSLLSRFQSGFRLVRFSLGIITVVLLGVIAMSSVTIVGPTEQAYIQRLGRPIDPDKPLGSGLRISYPWPIDRVIKVESLRMQRRSVGNSVDEETFALLWTRSHGSEEPFLTGDNKFFFPYLVIHYHVRSIGDYIIQHSTADLLLEELVMSNATHIFASETFDSIVGEKRGDIEQSIQKSVQEELNELHTGLEIIGIYFRDIHPPISIARSFEEVIAAKQDKERIILQARGKRNKNVPESRGEAVRMVIAAEGSVISRIKRAEGDSSRFVARAKMDARSKSITKRRLYLQSMTETLKKLNLVLVDPRSGVPTLFMGEKSALSSDQIYSGGSTP